MTALDLIFAAAAAFALNLVAGAWRGTQRRLSLRWFLAIHLPIPFVVALRLLLGLGWGRVPLMVACAIAGQLSGSWLFGLLRARRSAPLGCPLAPRDEAGGR